MLFGELGAVPTDPIVFALRREGGFWSKSDCTSTSVDCVLGNFGDKGTSGGGVDGAGGSGRGIEGGLLRAAVVGCFIRERRAEEGISEGWPDPVAVEGRR